MIVSNTWHRAADKFMEGINIPFLHIFDATAAAIKAAGLKKVALLGTKLTMGGPYASPDLARRAGVDVIVPDEENQEYIDRVIIDELAQMIIKPESRKGYLDIITKLVAHGAEGIVLGCTEIPLLITQKDNPNVPMFDTLELHAKGAVAVAFGELPLPTR
jgi:aspartate racemase